MKRPYMQEVTIKLKPERKLYADVPIDTPMMAAHLLGDLLSSMDREVVAMINLDNQLRPINYNIVSIGAVDYCMANPREIFKPAILSNAKAILLMHNHPSGALQPSKDDVAMTDRLIKLCSWMQIPLMDHIIVGEDSSKFFSMRDKGVVRFEPHNIPMHSNLYNLHFDESVPSIKVADKGSICL